MFTKLFVVLSLVAFSFASQNQNESNLITRLIDSETLPSGVQQYLDDQFVGLPEEEESVELVQPPRALEEVTAELIMANRGAPGSRAKRRIVRCRYVAIRNRRTGKTVVIVRCPK